MVLNIVALLVSLFVGWFVYAFGACQIILYHRCTKPYTAALALLYRGQIDSIIRAGRLTQTIWICIILVILAIIWFIHNVFIWYGFLGGFLFAWILTFGKIRPNRVNFEDYMMTYGKCFEERLMEDYKNKDELLEKIASLQ